MLQQKRLIISEIFCTPQWLEREDAIPPEIQVSLCDPQSLQELSTLKTGPEVVALVELPVVIASTLPDQDIIYLDNVQDPGNVGTIIRIADWYGIGTVIRSADSADFYTPRVVQSTMGSIASPHLMTLSVGDLLAQKEGHELIVSSLSGQPMTERPPAERPFILAIGSERRGVCDAIASGADRLVFLPGAEGRLAESLNASVAAGILCHHLRGHLM